MPVAVENTAHTTSITATARNTPLCSITWLTAKPTIAQPQPAHAITRGPSSTPNTTNTSDSNQAITNPTMPAITAINYGNCTFTTATASVNHLPYCNTQQYRRQHRGYRKQRCRKPAIHQTYVHQPCTHVHFLLSYFHFQRASCSPRNVGTTSSLRLIFLGISTKNTVSKLNE